MVAVKRSPLSGSQINRHGYQTSEAFIKDNCGKEKILKDGEVLSLVTENKKWRKIEKLTVKYNYC